jgi:hypothetical protein
MLHFIYLNKIIFDKVFRYHNYSVCSTKIEDCTKYLSTILK